TSRTTSAPRPTMTTKTRPRRKSTSCRTSPPRHARPADPRSALRVAARPVRAPDHGRRLARRVERALAVARRLVILLLGVLLGGHPVAEARRELRDRRVHLRHRADPLVAYRIRRRVQN